MASILSRKQAADKAKKAAEERRRITATKAREQEQRPSSEGLKSAMRQAEQRKRTATAQDTGADRALRQQAAEPPLFQGEPTGIAGGGIDRSGINANQSIEGAMGDLMAQNPGLSPEDANAIIHDMRADTGTGITNAGTDVGTGGTGADDGPKQLNVQNATLIRVNEAGGVRYYVEYRTHGVVLRHEIGDQAAFDDLGPQAWEATLTVGEAEFGGREGIDVGLIGERFGFNESYTATITRDLRVFGKEDLPAWQRNSPEVMVQLMIAANEGFSPGRTLGMIVELPAFKTQHPNFAAVRGIHTPGASLEEAFDFYIEARDEVRDSIRQYRGIEADVTDLTISEIMAAGWDPEEVEDILIGEAVLRQMPGMADQINAILEFQGETLRVTNDNLIDLILEGDTDRTPFEAQELINDAIRAQSFAQQGVELSAEFAASLGTGEAFETLDPNEFGKIAQSAAENIFRFGLELQAEREGLSRDDLIRAMVQGDQAAGVTEKLQKFARRRQIEASGFGVSAQQTGEGRLRLLGTSGL